MLSAFCSLDRDANIILFIYLFVPWHVCFLTLCYSDASCFFKKKSCFERLLVPIMLTTCSARLQSVRRRAASLQLDVTRRNPKSVSNFKMNIFGVAVFRLGLCPVNEERTEKRPVNQGGVFYSRLFLFPHVFKHWSHNLAR